MSETLSPAEPVINVIGQDIPGRSPSIEHPKSDGDTSRLDAAALDALSARRRREFDAARARLRDQAVRDDADLARQSASRPAGDEPPERESVNSARSPLDQVPERVRKRYLRAGNQYFLKDAPYQLAFEDIGPYLVTEHNRSDVLESMVDMVAAKSWRRIRVSGHEEFRCEVWLQASLLGIEVSGYEPKAADLARLADARQGRLNNRIEVDASLHSDGSPMPERSGAAFAPVSAAGRSDADGGAAPVSLRRDAESGRPREAQLHEAKRQPATGDEPDTPRRYTGELREHGGAPYQNNPARSESYYVVFRDATGADHVVWGVDLERAVRESGAQPGQQVALENLGRRLVTVKVPILDEHGVVIGEDERDVHRNTWQVEVMRQERAAAESVPRTGRVAGAEAAPVGTNAREGDQAPRRSSVSDEDKVLHLAVLVGAMREQGFSVRSIERVQRRAEAMLDAFGREGIPVPRPKVFDPKAPSERNRRARTAVGRTPARDIERELAHTPVEPAPAR
ncbi:LPD7 domain-containing protein [Paraburkholderia phenoliruptrix]|uniref:LPD7 domain-containing protein n=1 Tax=Paraburkholderia phenoliruptrix TaxID=252970 RepID=UPI0028699B18|nr:LPD7 domain-containing protein [Paraburkholderia phenoliruptrix]WMY09538.1 DNA primase [Paraburkholderia phenoliruptrix]